MVAGGCFIAFLLVFFLRRAKRKPGDMIKDCEKGE
jgi:hypothetical protein